MDITLFNSLSTEKAVEILRPCADIVRWAEEVAVGRPYASKVDLVSFAQHAATPWTEAEIDGALAQHPRIGEQAQGPSTEASMSRKEQSGVETSPEVQAKLLEGNRAYEHKFGRVFLIRAAGRSAPEILESLEKRLRNSAEEELPVVAHELREIAILRLKGLFES